MFCAPFFVHVPPLFLDNIQNWTHKRRSPPPSWQMFVLGSIITFYFYFDNWREDFLVLSTGRKYHGAVRGRLLVTCKHVVSTLSTGRPSRWCSSFHGNSWEPKLCLALCLSSVGCRGRGQSPDFSAKRSGDTHSYADSLSQLCCYSYSKQTKNNNRLKPDCFVGNTSITHGVIGDHPKLCLNVQPMDVRCTSNSLSL